jgi:hypothetical protein
MSFDMINTNRITLLHGVFVKGRVIVVRCPLAYIGDPRRMRCFVSSLGGDVGEVYDRVPDEGYVDVALREVSE